MSAEPGTWAAECKQGPSPGNTHATYAVTSVGALELKNARGKVVKKQATYAVTTHPQLLVLRQDD